MHIFVWHVSTSGYTPGPRGRNMSVPSPATTPGRPSIDLVSRSRRRKVVILSSVALAILFCNMQVAIVYILSPEVWRADHEACTNLLTRFAGRADAVFGLAITSMATDIDLSFRYEITYLQSQAHRWGRPRWPHLWACYGRLVGCTVQRLVIFEFKLRPVVDWCWIPSTESCGA